MEIVDFLLENFESSLDRGFVEQKSMDGYFFVGYSLGYGFYECHTKDEVNRAPWKFYTDDIDNIHGLLGLIEGFSDEGYKKFISFMDDIILRGYLTFLFGRKSGSTLGRNQFMDFATEKSKGVYHLIKGGEVVYVGQTGNFFKRIGNHFQDKDFDTIKIKYVKNDDVRGHREWEDIAKYKPKYNKDKPRAGLSDFL